MIAFFTKYRLYIVILSFVIVVVNILTQYNNYIEQKEALITTLVTKTSDKDREKKKLDISKAELKELEESMSLQKVDLEVKTKQIEEVLKVINSNKNIRAEIEKIEESKNFVNVAKAQIKIVTTFQNFNAKSFESSLIKRFQPVGYVVKTMYKQNEAMYLLVLIKKVEQNDEKQKI